MVRIYLRAAVAALVPFSVSFAFQSSSEDGPISMIPVARRIPAPEAAPTTAIRIDSSLVLIPAHVTTTIGAPVTNLTKADFRLFEDNVEQRITQFAMDDAPISIGLLFDASGSMRSKIHKGSEAAAAFFRTANPEDEFFLVEFGDRPRLTVPFTADPARIYRRIAGLRPFGRTSLLDAIHMALAQMKGARNSRKALVVVSDGGDNSSRQTAGQIKHALVESDLQLYSMGIFEGDESHPQSREERNGPTLLDTLAGETGGHNYPINNLDQLPALSARISKELRTEYLLGYSPAGAARDGKYHRVRVTLAAPTDGQKLRTYYRQGYYAPAQ